MKNHFNKYLNMAKMHKKKIVLVLILSIVVVAFAVFSGVFMYGKYEEKNPSAVTTTTTTVNASNTKSESEHFILIDQSIGGVSQ